MLRVSQTAFPNGTIIKHPNNRMSAPFVQNLGDIMKQAAFDQATDKWLKNKVKKGGLNHIEGQESFLRLAKKLIKTA